MTQTGVSRASSGILVAPRRGPLRILRDLWRGGGAFRGFTEFALVGALVLAFLPGGKAIDLFRSMRAGHDSANSAPASTPIIAPTDKDGLLAAPPEKKPVAPRLSDLKIPPAYFNGIAQPLHGYLIGAVDAYRARNPAGVDQALANADPEDRRVLLMRGLGKLLMTGPDDVAAGIGLLEQAVAKGEPRAMAVLGVLKMNGIAGYPRDLAAGRDLLDRAVEAGDGPAARVLAEGYMSGYSGAIDAGKAESLLRLASDRGDLASTYRLGELLLTGRGLPKNEIAGERLVEIAAKAGYAEAQATMGTIRLKPYLAEATDNPDEALGWYERAAAQGNSRGMFNLGIFYVELGARIRRTDAARATELFRRCAEATLNSQCVFAYATSLDYGMGTSRDPIKAYALYSMAVLAGDKPKAKQRRDEIGKTLSAEDKAQATLVSNQIYARAPVAKTVDAKFKPVPTTLQSSNNSSAPAKTENSASVGKPDRLERVFKVQ